MSNGNFITIFPFSCYITILCSVNLLLVKTFSRASQNIYSTHCLIYVPHVLILTLQTAYKGICNSKLLTIMLHILFLTCIAYVLEIIDSTNSFYTMIVASPLWLVCWIHTQDSKYSTYEGFVCVCGKEKKNTQSTKKPSMLRTPMGKSNHTLIYKLETSPLSVIFFLLLLLLLSFSPFTAAYKVGRCANKALDVTRLWMYSAVANRVRIDWWDQRTEFPSTLNSRVMILQIMMHTQTLKNNWKTVFHTLKNG